jgi:regulatory protein SWI6
MTTLLTQNLASHRDLLRQRTEQIDLLNEQIREFSALQAIELVRLQETQARVKLRAERQAKVANLKRYRSERLAALSPTSRAASQAPPATKQTELGDADSHVLPFMFCSSSTLPALLSTDSPPSLSLSLPSLSTIRPLVQAYKTNNSTLRTRATDLRSRSSELEAMYRRVVSICTNTPEERVDDALRALGQAVESEGSGIRGEGELGRVRDFLRRVDGGGGGAGAGSGGEGRGSLVGWAVGRE